MTLELCTHDCGGENNPDRPDPGCVFVAAGGLTRHLGVWWWRRGLPSAERTILDANNTTTTLRRREET